MNECCKTCNYCCEVRERSSSYRNILTKICVLHLLQSGDAYILEVDDKDICECYVKYKE